MTTKRLGVLAAVLLAGSWLGGTARADDPADKPGDGVDPDALVKMFEALAAPGAEHKNLEFMVGHWKTETKSYFKPGEPEVSEGTATFEMILGGRFLLEKVESEFNGRKFEGGGVFGYDKAKQKYVSVWLDNMGTGIMMSEGTFDDDAKTLSEASEMDTPMGKLKSRAVYKVVDDDTVVLTAYMTWPGGKEAKVMEVTYRRQ